MKRQANRLVGALALAGIAVLLLTTLFVGRAWAQPGFAWGGHGGWGPGMGGYGPWAQPGGSGERLSGGLVETRVNEYLARSFNDPDLVVAEIMEFQNNFYVQVEEASTGIHAFELLVDPYTGRVGPEYGPNMMWNTKYGHMGSRGMAGPGGWRGNRTQLANTALGQEEARQRAQQYLDARKSGLTVAQEADTFYGYYTIHTLDQAGKIEGMLSVNGYSGQVWYHDWHGPFVGMLGHQTGETTDDVTFSG